MSTQVIDHTWEMWETNDSYGSTGPHLAFTIKFPDGIKVHGEQARWYNPKSRYGRPSAERAKLDRKARVYVWSDTPWSLLEDLKNRYRRPHDLYKPYVEDVFTRLDVVSKFRWNQRAGCSCGCSPAFIADAPELKGWEFYITIPNLVTVDEDQPARNIVVTN